jgi:MFS family permease
MFGSLNGGRFISKGRRIAMFLAIGIGIMGCSISCLQNEIAIIFGRILFGYSSGLMSTATNRYVDEYVPLVLFPKVAPIYSVSLNVGSLIATFPATVLPKDDSPLSVLEANTSWHYVFGFPVALYFILLLGFLFIVKTDTPKYYLLKRDRAMAKIAVKATYYLDND